MAQNEYERTLNMLAYADKHKFSDHYYKLSVDLMLIMSFEYLCQYVKFFELGFEFGVAEV